jgi:nitrite reductase/ring-hydroxylating ferredoxin subunit
MLMAFTSHEFWLKNLGPRIWKGLHMSVYVAYLLLLFHVILGALQNENSLVITYIVAFGGLSIIGLHIVVGYKEYKKDEVLPEGVENWIRVGALSDIPDKRAKIVNTFEDRVAVFRNGRKVSAVSNFCKHQGGPLGEGKIVGGTITCPWHGYQYYPKNGCSPPPFEEKVHTYNLKLMDGLIFLYPKPNPEGTEVTPLEIKKDEKR